MNKTLAVLIVGTAVLGTAACSSTRTQRAPGEQVDDAALLTSVKSALAADSASTEPAASSGRAAAIGAPASRSTSATADGVATFVCDHHQ